MITISAKAEVEKSVGPPVQENGGPNEDHDTEDHEENEGEEDGTHAATNGE